MTPWRRRGAAVGSVQSLWRYPVKSMGDEQLQFSAVTERGLVGDRAYGLVDKADGEVATAKNPRKWPQLFQFGAALAATPAPGRPLPPALITLPDRQTVNSDQGDIDTVLSGGRFTARCMCRKALTSETP